jgi:hypothetical protein
MHPKEDPSSLRAPTRPKATTQSNTLQITHKNNPNNPYKPNTTPTNPTKSTQTPHNRNPENIPGPASTDPQACRNRKSPTSNHILPVFVPYPCKLRLQLRELHRTYRRRSNLVLPPSSHLKTINNGEQVMVPSTIPQPPKKPSLSFSQTMDRKLSLGNGQNSGRRHGPFADFNYTRKLRQNQDRSRLGELR